MKVYYKEELENLRLDLIEDLLDKETLVRDELRRMNRYYYHPQGVRRCSACENVLAANSDNFYVKRHYRDDAGEITSIGLSGNCIPCDKIRLSKDKSRQRNDPELYCRRVVPSLKSRAKEQSVPFDMTGEQLYKILEGQNFECFYTKGKLDFTVTAIKDNHPNRLMPSIDKVNPSLGYVVDNVVWTYYYVNRMKNDLNLEEFIELCHLVIKNTTPESGRELHQKIS